MSLVTTTHVALLVVSTLTTATLAAYAWHNRSAHAAPEFAGLMLSFVLYSSGHLVSLLTTDPTWRLVWDSLKWTGTATAPVLWLLFVFEYTGYDELADRTTVGLLSILPAITVLLAATNPLHRLLWSHRQVATVEGLAILDHALGPWVWVFATFAYTLVGFGCLLLLRLVRDSDYLYTDQAALLLVGIVVPLVASVATLFELPRLGEVTLNVTPYAFIVTGPAFGYALFRRRLLDLVPAARQFGYRSALRDLEDGVLILDADRRVLYCNAAAADLLDVDRERVVGSPAPSIVEESSLHLDAEDALAEVERDDGVYEVRSSPIHGRNDELIGHTLVVREITARKRRERRLARQRDELARLDELNAVIRGVNRALVSATTREEIEQTVCERLTERELYDVVCVAGVPTWNGDADRWTVAADGETVEEFPLPLESDAPEGSTPADVSEDVDLEGPSDEDGPTVVDGQLWTIVPLVYGHTVYGALGLEPNSDDDPSMTDREREVLAELGELVGQAIDAVEARRLLAAESVVELELQCSDEDEPLVRAVADRDCRLTVSGLVPDAGDGPVAYVEVEDGSAEGVAAELAGDDDQPEGGDGENDGNQGDGEGDDDQGDKENDDRTAARVVRGGEEGGLVEWTVPGETVLGTLLARGAKVPLATAEDGHARFTAELASDADVRTLVERVQTALPNTSLASMTERNRPIERADSVPEDTVEDLTDRQQEALEAAYRAGYYDWPRDSTAEEVAETLDISAPTLHAHLRKAEGSLLATLFEQERERSRGD